MFDHLEDVLKRNQQCHEATANQLSRMETNESSTHSAVRQNQLILLFLTACTVVSVFLNTCLVCIALDVKREIETIKGEADEMYKAYKRFQ